MKSFIASVIVYFLLILASSVFAQEKNKVVITGVRFAYPIVEKWIKDYNVENPGVNVVIEARTTTDPALYDLLIEAYEPEKSVKESRDYLYLAKYALLPVANAKSAFAKTYGDKGLTSDLIKQIYFNDIFSDKKKEKEINVDYTIYTRLQKAGAPITFAHYFGYEQNDIQGNAISGGDEHLVKALLRDTSAISYNVPGLLYNLQTRKQLDGLTIIPVDTDGNGRISSEEKFYSNLDVVLEQLETGNFKNIPVESLHISISKSNTNTEAIKFLQWVARNSQQTLSQFGFLKPDAKRFQQEKAKFDVALNP